MNVPPEIETAFAVNGPPMVMEPPLTPSVLLITDTLLPSVSVAPPTCTCSRLDIAAAACEPVLTVMVCAPTRSGISTAWLAMGVPRLQFEPTDQSPPTVLIHVLTTSAPDTFIVALLAPYMRFAVVPKGALNVPNVPLSAPPEVTV